MRAGEIIDPATEIANLMAWWREAGVDVLVDEESRDWLAPPPARIPIANPQATAQISTAAKPVEDSPPDTLPAFHAWLATSATIPGPTAGRIAPAGNVASGLMMLIDQPEADDSEAGQMMSGEVGRLFDRMIAAIGRDRASIYLAAMLPARAPGGYVDPATVPLLTRIARHHAALAAPRALLLLGEAPSRALLGLGFVEARGRIHEIDMDGTAVRAVATFHPRTLLQHPAQKARAWADLQLVMTMFA